MPKSPDEIVAEIDRKQNEEDLQLPKRAWEKAKEIGRKVFQSDSEAFKDLQEAKAKEREASSEKARERTRGVKPMKKGGKVSSASSRADGIAQRGKTKGRMV